MVDHLHKKRTNVPVVVGDMETSTMPGQFSHLAPDRRSTGGRPTAQ